MKPPLRGRNFIFTVITEAYFIFFPPQRQALSQSLFIIHLYVYTYIACYLNGCNILYYSFLALLIDLEKLQVPSKIEWGVQRLLIFLLPPHMHNLPIYQYLHQSGTFLVTDEPTLILYYHPVSIVHIRIHFWCTFCEFGQMYNGMYSPFIILYRVVSLT